MESAFCPSSSATSETYFETVRSLSYWTMHFDVSPEKQKSLSKLLRKDPRVIRATVLKMGERIEDVAWKSPKTIIPARDESKVA
jgi:ribosomal protein S6